MGIGAQTLHHEFEDKAIEIFRDKTAIINYVSN